MTDFMICNTCGAAEDRVEVGERKARNCRCGLCAGPLSGTPGESFLDKLAEELGRARDKFPGTDCLFSALSEELGELARELDKPTAEIDWARVEAEARQVACVATRIATERFDPETEDHLVYAAAKIGENLARRHMASMEEEGRSGS